MNNRAEIPRAVGRYLMAAAIVGLSGGPAVAQPSALVISNSNYTVEPKLASCELSANLVSSVLTRAGFKVVRQSNLSNARLGTAIASLGEDAAVTPGSRSLIYICSYTVTYSDRLFILPAQSKLERDSDVLSQGIVARLLMSSVAGPGSAAGLVLMDVAPAPKTAPMEFSSMLRSSDAAHGGLVAAALPANETLGPAPVAAAISENVGQGPLEIGALLATLSAQPALRRSLLTIRPPTDPSWLVGGPTAEPVSAALPVVPPVAAPAPAAVAAPPTAAPAVPDVALADPNPAERRRLQLSLSKLGYYRGRVDGVFAGDTATAIRQFQRDSNAEATGKLTVKQMDQLLQ